MDETAWLTCADPTRMVNIADASQQPGGRERRSPLAPPGARERKARLIPCATARRYCWPLLTDDRSRNAIVAAEQYADGAITSVDLEVAYEGAVAAWQAQRDRPGRPYLAAAAAVRHLAHLARSVGMPALIGVQTSQEVMRAVGVAVYTEDEQQYHCELLREVYGNPLCPVAVDPGWRFPGVTGLAAAIYAGGAFDRLPALANALVAVGCADQTILSHCRSSGPHARGCWVVDLFVCER